jgi:hypothetical protein
VLSTPEFAEFAENVIAFCHLTTRIDGEPNDDLLRRKGGSMFPFLAFLDTDGKVLALPRGRTVEVFRATLEGDVAAFRELKAKAATGDPDARRALFAKRVALRHFEDFDAAREELAELEGLSDEERAELTQALVDQEFNLILGSVRSEADAADAGERCLPMYRAGRIPAGSLACYYWFFLATQAVRASDAERLREAIDRIEASGHPKADEYLPKLRAALEGLEKDR